jgi:hypothetical protein
MPEQVGFDPNLANSEQGTLFEMPEASNPPTIPQKIYSNPGDIPSRSLPEERVSAAYADLGGLPHEVPEDEDTRKTLLAAHTGPKKVRRTAPGPRDKSKPDGQEQTRRINNEQTAKERAAGITGSRITPGYLVAKATLLLDNDAAKAGGDSKEMIIESKLREVRNSKSPFLR